MNLNDTRRQVCPGCNGNGWHNGVIGSRICERGCSGSGWVRWGLWAKIADDHARGVAATHASDAAAEAAADAQDRLDDEREWARDERIAL